MASDIPPLKLVKTHPLAPYTASSMYVSCPSIQLSYIDTFERNTLYNSMHHKPTYFYISLTISDTLFNSYAEPQILSDILNQKIALDIKNTHLEFSTLSTKEMYVND